MAPEQEAELGAIHLVQGAGDDVEAFSGVYPSSGVAKPSEVRVDTKRLFADGGILRSEGIEVYSIRNVFYLYLGDHGACRIGKPTGWCYESCGAEAGEEMFTALESSFKRAVWCDDLGGA